MSSDLAPFEGGYGRIFFKSQLFTHLQPPPKDLDLSGQTVIITGGTSGIGLECVKHLLPLKPARLIIPARNLEKGEHIAKPLRKTYPKTRLEIWSLDMASYDSIQNFVKRCNETLDRIDFVILGAVSVQVKMIPNPDTGHEETFQITYLSTVLLSLLLLPVLKAKRPPNGKPGRLTLVSSALGYTTKFAIQDQDPLIPAFDKPEFFDMERYADTKLMIMFFVATIKDYVSADDVVVNCLEPGFMKNGTGLDRNAPGAIKVAASVFRALMGRPIKGGAWMYIDSACVKGKESHGSFLHNWEIYPWPKMMYTPEGKMVMERLWRETLDEFQFAGVREILSAMKGHPV